MQAIAAKAPPHLSRLPRVGIPERNAARNIPSPPRRALARQRASPMLAFTAYDDQERVFLPEAGE
jgi:hypothetical protein